MIKNIIILIATLFSCSCLAGEVYHTEINIKNHYFEPSIIEVPANTRIKLTVINHDDTAEEFESLELKREKLVFANSKTVVSFGPLMPGEYKFFGEFHEETAQGKIIVK